MNIEEPRLKYVGKLALFTCSPQCNGDDIGIITAIEESTHNPDTFHARFTRSDGELDRFYFQHTPTRRQEWHIHLYDESCPVEAP